MGMKTTLKELILRLHEIGCFQFGEFVLTSGQKSPYYIDLRKIVSYPAVFRSVIEQYMLGLKEVDDFDVVVGIETGSIPIAAAISYELRVPMIYVRKKKKEVGRGRLIEGDLVEGSKAVIIEDVVTTGGSIARAVEAVRDAGGKVEFALALVDRLQGGRERLRGIGVDLVAILNIVDVFEVLLEENRISPSTYKKVMDYVGGVVKL